MISPKKGYLLDNSTQKNVFGQLKNEMSCNMDYACISISNFIEILVNSEMFFLITYKYNSQ